MTNNRLNWDSWDYEDLWDMYTKNSFSHKSS
jgi:hypothetical protein